jgi:hypothetical protein
MKIISILFIGCISFLFFQPLTSHSDDFCKEKCKSYVNVHCCLCECVEHPEDSCDVCTKKV